MHDESGECMERAELACVGSHSTPLHLQGGPLGPAPRPF